MKIGICTSFKNIHLAKEFGFDFIELPGTEIMKISDLEWSRYRDYIITSNIDILSFNSFCDKNNPLVGPFVDRKKNTDYINTILKRANDLNCHYIGIGAPDARIIPPDFPYEYALNQMNEFLINASTLASTYNITILYEAIHPFLCNFGNSTREVYNTIKFIGSSSLKLVWDMYHSCNSSESFPPYIFDECEHVHICSWDNDRNRLFLSANDSLNLSNLKRFLNTHNYTKSISLEADDSLFFNNAKNSLKIMKEFFD